MFLSKYIIWNNFYLNEFLGDLGYNEIYILWYFKNFNTFSTHMSNTTCIFFVITTPILNTKFGFFDFFF